MNLFQSGNFILHSGKKSRYKIDCDALTLADWDTLALMAVERLTPFGSVVGVPRGGILFAAALQKYVTQGPRLIADDVLTTGKSMQEMKVNRGDIGVVVFARGDCPNWITPIFWCVGGKE